ncbi:MAG: amidohydrolase family protein [Gemmatimonadota bacterium]
MRVRRTLGVLAAAALAAGLAAAPLGAQQTEVAGTYAIRGATIHTLAGPEIQNGTVVLRDGKIFAVGTDVRVPPDAVVIDAAGQHVYPGMVDAFSRLGLTEIGSVSATNDMVELGHFNPQLEAYQAIHPASEHIPVARANGITHTLVAPGGGGRFGGGGSAGIAGQATLLNLDGWTVEDMALERSAAMVINWPTIQTRTFDFATFSTKEKPYTEAKKAYDEQVDKLENWAEAAEHYRQARERGAKIETDLKLEALSRAVAGELPVIVVANDKRAIESAVEFAERHHLKLILAGARDGRKVAGMLAEKHIPVILGQTQALPAERDDPYYYPRSLPGELYVAGVKIAFGTFGSSDSRTLPYQAANAVPFGLPYDEALRAVTANAADMLGVAAELGTIEPGKMGNLIVTDGDPLEIQTHIEHLFIRGRPVSTDNKHRRLWEKYRKRPAKTKITTD